jgi:hypothetical protein
VFRLVISAGDISPLPKAFAAYVIATTKSCIITRVAIPSMDERGYTQGAEVKLRVAPPFF